MDEADETDSVFDAQAAEFPCCGRRQDEGLAAVLVREATQIVDRVVDDELQGIHRAGNSRA